MLAVDVDGLGRERERDGWQGKGKRDGDATRASTFFLSVHEPQSPISFCRLYTPLWK